MVFATLGAVPAFAGFDTAPANAAESILVTEQRAAQDELITRDVVEVLSKAGVPRYAELVAFSDDPGEAAANYYLLKLMGFTDVKVLMP